MTKLPSCGGMFVGKGRFVHQNIPCDYIGVTVPEARGFFCDAKCCGIDQRGLRVHDPKIVKDHQRLFLIRMQMVGALAGVLVEAKRIGRYLWLDAVHLNDQKAIPWTDSRWVYLGSTDRLIDFGMLLTK